MIVLKVLGLLLLIPFVIAVTFFLILILPSTRRLFFMSASRYFSRKANGGTFVRYRTWGYDQPKDSFERVMKDVTPKNGNDQLIQ